jgi:hypothetical protein
LIKKKTSRDPQMLVGGKSTYMHVLQWLLCRVIHNLFT